MSDEARPSVCPICGLTSNNGMSVQHETSAVSTYVCTEGHLWVVMWTPGGDA